MGATDRTDRRGSAPDATDFALELILARLHPGCIVPFGDLDRTVAEQLRHAVEPDPLQQERDGERVAEPMRVAVRYDGRGRLSDLPEDPVPALDHALGLAGAVVEEVALIGR